MPEEVTYDVRVYKTEVYKGRRVTTYKVRWKVGGKLWKEGFRIAAQADSFRSALLTAARKGEAFSAGTGRPTSWERGKADTTWYEFACQFADMKWKRASAKYRKDIARALTAASPVLLAGARGRPDDAAIRRALLRYGFNTKQRVDPPEDVAEVLTWLARNSPPMSALAEPALARRVLDQATWPTRWQERSTEHGATASHHPGQRDGLRHRTRPAGHQSHPRTQVDSAESL